ncbi:MAG: conjugal transfer protein TraX [Peptococcaceae bacterium]|jgi:hypothetical protein|nr:conjugal transfer protein TraX [Peptococcaceae bacterium]
MAADQFPGGRHGGGQLTKRQSNYIKLVAIAAMFVDHAGLLLFPGTVFFRIAGRISFPLFAYQIGVSYEHTRSFKKYILKLLLCALIFQGFYFAAQWVDASVDPGYLNIFFTLALGLFLIWLADRRRYLLAAGSLALPVLASGAGLTVDYGVYGAAMILFLYLLKNKPFWTIFYLGASTFLYCFFAPGGSFLQMYCLLAAVCLFKPLSLRRNIPGWFFYGFYPSHLLLLYGIRELLTR